MVTRLPEEGEALRPQQVLPLEYAPPRPRGSRRDLWLGLIICFVFSTGVGWFVFGMLMGGGWRDDNAGPVAVGLALMVLGLSLTGLLWLRRSPPR